MNCNDRIQKIKRAISGLSGTYEHYVDFPQQRSPLWVGQNPGKRKMSGGRGETTR
ncbi:unnamed protein product [Victoria cruziana]